MFAGHARNCVKPYLCWEEKTIFAAISNWPTFVLAYIWCQHGISLIMGLNNETAGEDQSSYLLSISTS